MVDIVMRKMLEDCPNLDENMTLQYAISTRNCCLHIQIFTSGKFALMVKSPDNQKTLNDTLPASDVKS